MHNIFIDVAVGNIRKKMHGYQTKLVIVESLY